MQINSVVNSPISRSNTFGNGYVTLSKPNLADVISQDVDKYNAGDFAKMYDKSREISGRIIAGVNTRFPNQDVRIKNVDDLENKVDAYILAGGSGSRFKPMAMAVGNYNKISVPFELGNGQADLTMLGIPMAMGRFFVDRNGYKKIVADRPTGSFGDVVLNYLNTGREPRDVVVCCGDNVFDMRSEDMLDFVVGTINNPQKQLGVVGVARTPDEVAKRFGVLKVGAQDSETGLFSLEGFVEKPELEAAKKLTTPDGNNVANTGMFVIKKESMEKLLDIIRYEQKVLGGKTLYIAKDPVKEIYDFAAATKWAQALNGSAASDVKIVKTWEDVGEPKAYLRWAQQMKDGHYLDNFTPERKTAILKALKDRVGDDYIQFTLNPTNTTTVDGIKVIA